MEEEKPTYIIKDGFRYVEPYKYEYITYTKKRWLNRKLIDVFASEFKKYSRGYYEKAILEGRIKANGQKVDLNYKLKNNDKITHETLRKETPVLDLPVEIIHDDDQILVVNKPHSFPVHACGGYRYNTLIYILKYIYGYNNLFCVHRLDRQTSGIVILPKNEVAAKEFSSDMVSHLVQKTYLARVRGEVKEEEFTIDKGIYALSYKDCFFEALEDPKQKEKLNAKDAITVFKKKSYDEASNTTLLECLPKTGRTHQIRVHLKSYGHPIANDVMYGGILFDELHYGKPENELKEEVKEEIKAAEKEEVVEPGKVEFDEDEEDLDKKCHKIWLHAQKYQYKGNTFECKKLPEWATDSLIINYKF